MADLFRTSSEIFGERYHCPCCGPRDKQERKELRRRTRAKIKQMDLRDTFRCDEGD